MDFLQSLFPRHGNFSHIPVLYLFRILAVIFAKNLLYSTIRILLPLNAFTDKPALKNLFLSQQRKVLRWKHLFSRL